MNAAKCGEDFRNGKSILYKKEKINGNKCSEKSELFWLLHEDYFQSSDKDSNK